MSKFSAGNMAGAKVSNEAVYEMRLRYMGLHDGRRWSQGELARHYGIAVNTVGRIVRNEVRQSVPMPQNDEDRTKLARDLMRFQEQAGDAALDKMRKEATKVVEKETKPNKQLDELADWGAAEKFGVIPEGEKDG